MLGKPALFPNFQQFWVSTGSKGFVLFIPAAQAQEEVDRVLGDRSKPNMGERCMGRSRAQRGAAGCCRAQQDVAGHAPRHMQPA